MTHPKPDNAPTPAGPVLSALETGWLGEILSKNKEFMDEVPESLGGTGVVIKELRGLLVQRDKRVEELEVRLGEVSKVCARSLITSKNRQVALLDIQRLSTGWKYSNEGNHLLRINDVASAALDDAMKEPG